MAPQRKSARKSTKGSSADKPKRLSMYTVALDDGQMTTLEDFFERNGWEFSYVDHTRFAYRNKQVGVNAVGYKSGKLVVQGKGTEDFVRDVLEAQVTGEARLGYDRVNHPDWFEPHAGMDEAGKGDLFGPLVTACVVADATAVESWLEAGVKDSKAMTDTTILKLDKVVRGTRGVIACTASCSMPKYNELMAKPRANLNLFLAWLHAKSLEDALRRKRVPWGLLDQFSKQPLVQRYFKDKTFDLRMRTKAESDPVVAAASIVARAEYVRSMDKLSKAAGVELRKGASAAVKKQATEIARKGGAEALAKIAKMHFKTAKEALALAGKS